MTNPEHTFYISANSMNDSEGMTSFEDIVCESIQQCDDFISNTESRITSIEQCINDCQANYESFFNQLQELHQMIDTIDAELMLHIKALDECAEYCESAQQWHNNLATYVCWMFRILLFIVLLYLAL